MITRSFQTRTSGLLALALLIGASSLASAQQSPQPAPSPDRSMDIDGFAMLEIDYQAPQNDPFWYDVLRATKLPPSSDEFGENGRSFAGVRQTRFGVKAPVPTSLGDLKTISGFDLFGVGVDAGGTTFRVRDASGDVRRVGTGQTDSPFMDGSTLPNTIEYWGPTGLVYFKNVQARYSPVRGDNEIVFALERPGAGADAGVYVHGIERQNAQARFPRPLRSNWSCTPLRKQGALRLDESVMQYSHGLVGPIARHRPRDSERRGREH